MTYRPKFHFAPQSGWCNDPNGLVFHDGLWHLFFQHHPHSCQWGPMHWGHAVSRDLVSWEEWPIAIAPDEIGAIWSGSAAIDSEKIVAAFTHHGEEGEAQSLAFSSDGGRTFEKFAGNPVLKSERRDFRDPKIWKMGESWRMIVAAGKTAQIFSSPDLFSWALESEIPTPFEGWIWECPDLFELEGQWVLLGSFYLPDGPREMFYWIGDFNGQNFTPQTQVQQLSFGPDDYAAVSFNNAPDERRILIGWMNNWDYAGKTPTENDGFCGAMTLPRELSIREGKLAQNPVRELEKYRSEAIDISGLQGVLPNVGDCFEAELKIEIGLAERIGFFLRVGHDEASQVGFDTQKKQLFIDRSESWNFDIHPSFDNLAVCPFEAKNGILKLRIFVDACSIEVFADGNYGAALVFHSDDGQGVGFFEEKARILSGTIWPLYFE